jgi:phenylacetate-CoA ligase
VLAEYVKEYKIAKIDPTAIISSSMMLLPHEGEVIKEVFKKKVFDRYGCEEVGLIASECEMHGGLHLNIDNLYIEFNTEEGSPASPGEFGKIIVSDLRNWAMPFIRYQVEDVGVSSEKKCSCARGLPLMEGVVGRVADFLVKKDGSRVAVPLLTIRSLLPDRLG